MSWMKCGICDGYINTDEGEHHDISDRDVRRMRKEGRAEMYYIETGEIICSPCFEEIKEQA